MIICGCITFLYLENANNDFHYKSVAKTKHIPLKLSNKYALDIPALKFAFKATVLFLFAL